MLNLDRLILVYISAQNVLYYFLIPTKGNEIGGDYGSVYGITENGMRGNFLFGSGGHGYRMNGGIFFRSEMYSFNIEF